MRHKDEAQLGLLSTFIGLFIGSKASDPKSLYSATFAPSAGRFLWNTDHALITEWLITE